MSSTLVYSLKLEQLRQSLGNSCFNCGSQNNLEFAHLKPTKLKGTGRGLKYRYLDIIRNLNSYTLLCKQCHTEMDNNIFWIYPQIQDLEA